MGATGIVLAGGESRRMGSDKARLRIAGQPVLDRIIEAVSRVCDEVVVAGRPSSRANQPAGQVTWVQDPPGTRGPLAGLAAGFGVARHEHCIVVACDMPFVDDRLLAHLLETLGESDAAVPLSASGPQPLHAAYARRCLPTVQSILRLGGRSMRELLPRLLVAYVPESRCRAIDPGGLSWFNMNRPEDYGEVQRLLAGGRLTSAA